jgi:hypothetical protein
MRSSQTSVKLDAAASGPDAFEPADPFLRRFLERVPTEVARSFTAAQLEAVKMAFGARSWGDHALEFRRAIGAGRWRFYVVFLAGRARRTSDGHGSRRASAVKKTSAALLLGLVLTAAMMGGIGALYAAKRALHIDIIPGVDMLPDKDLERLIP